ncbi:hypothetical protein BH09MYX1_BH09MYX1_16450 [soil metagenome]
MHFRFLFALGFSFASVTACGGRVEDTPDAATDASTGGDATKGDAKSPVDVIVVDVILPPKPDAAPIACGTKTGEGSIGSGGECSERDEWKCNDGYVYEISCKCPVDPDGQTCACRRNGLTTKVFAGAVCPSCTGVGKLAAQCGLPA